ncbi:cytochrome P450 [Bradyrhizobium sp. dw_78]|uniref:cytochrome P450 n=1 Tax=Bradyrhizobium sp. dw_78 TaxID=2719793 RepID=UPI001BD6332D|nr:cytochrome P450 [Bradyrhizobium sp. dw_78]
MPRTCPFDPPPALRESRANNPLTRVRLWNDQVVWLATRYDDVRSLLSDPRVSADSGHPGFPGQSPGMQLMRKNYRTFMSMDPPEHGFQRRMLTAEFTVKRIEQLRPRMQEIVDGCIDAMLAKGPPAEIVEDLTLALPSFMICDLLGVPYEDQDFFQSRASIIASSKTPPARAAEVAKELCDGYIGDLIDRKNTNPQDDLLSRVVVAQYQTGKISRQDLISMARLLLVAGHETSANTMGMGILTLLENPDQLKFLMDDPSLLTNAVEEILRYVDVAHSGRRRTAMADIEIAGVVIRSGEGIIAHNPSANRDVRMFEDADRFDIRRNTSGHVAFGYGVHQCLGQPLARAELQTVFGTLFRRIPTLRLAVPFSELKFKDDMFVYGVESLPVSW